MKALLLVSTPPGDSRLGGTEIVAQGIAKRLRASGADVCIAGHVNGVTETKHEVTGNGVSVVSLPQLPRPERAALFSMRVPEAPGFSELLAQKKPNVVQIFGLTGDGVNRRHIELAKAARSKTVLWHNVPGITCLQRGLLYLGRTPCDGRVEVQRCTSCRLQATRVPRYVAEFASRFGVGRLSEHLPHRVESLLGARHLTTKHKLAFEEAFEHLDAIQVGANWARDLLVKNGVPPHKLHLIRPGVNVEDVSESTEPGRDIWQHHGADQPIRLIYWGRVHRSKGVHTLIEAMSIARDLRIEVAIVGEVKAHNAYGVELVRQAEADARIRFVGPLPPDRVLPFLRTADVAIIPSRWHETGPLTVFEAQAAKLPVIGSDRGGIAELCDGPWARLFPAEDAQALAAVMQEVLTNAATVEQMRDLIPTPRTMQDVGNDVYDLYSRLVEDR